MENRYDQLMWETNTPTGSNGWIGNLRWLAKETESANTFRYVTIPVSRAYERPCETEPKAFNRFLFDLTVHLGGAYQHTTYRADGIAITYDGTATGVFPWTEYGSIWEIEKVGETSIILRPDERGQWLKVEDEVYAFYIEPYYLAFYCPEATAQLDKGQLMLHLTGMGCLAIAYHTEKEHALSDARRLHDNAAQLRRESRSTWEQYLDSCPIVEFDRDYEYKNAFTGETERYTSEEIAKRQLWYWWCALLNISQISFNRAPLYVAPDKTNWGGTWSNDGPETLAALSLTNAAPLAKACILSYISQSVSNDGVLSWYTHYDGTGCRDVPGDVGRYSHGVPNIVHTVGFYVQNTGDTGILKEIIRDGITLWDVLKRYMTCTLEVRDLNGDGLIEWSNLWETGWDDKLCAFFEKADLDAWINAAMEPEDVYNCFWEENARPITTIVEQVYLLWALQAMIFMSRIMGDMQTENFCISRLNWIQKIIAERHWGDDGFYHDWDVKRNALEPSKNTDAFYYLYYEQDSVRKAAMMEKLRDPEEFAMYYLPMSSRKNRGFSEWGYWSGGHWPREMGYVGLALNQAGYQKEALDYIIRALCCAPGNIVPEVLNPITGERSTAVTKMAYDVLNNIALLQCFGKCRWT